jgi:hypothetical protein
MAPVMTDPTALQSESGQKVALTLTVEDEPLIKRRLLVMM